MRLYTIIAVAVGVSGLIELLIGVLNYTEGSQEIWRFERLGLTLQTVSLPIWLGCLSVILGMSMLALQPKRY